MTHRATTTADSFYSTAIWQYLCHKSHATVAARFIARLWRWRGLKTRDKSRRNGKNTVLLHQNNANQQPMTHK